MPRCNSRDSETTKVPLMDRERHPHRSGQEYEYGETPETGLGGAGVGTDPDKQCAHHSPDDDHSIRGERDATDQLEQEDEAETRQGGGSSENNGFARNRDEKHPAPKGGRRAQYDDQHSRPDIQGQQGVPPEVEHDR
jgi:hypothetical protein